MLHLDHTALIDLIDAAYDGQPNHGTWCSAVMKAGLRLATRSRTATWFEYTWHFERSGFVFDSIHSAHVLGRDAARATWLGARQRLPPAITGRLFGRSCAGTASQVSGIRVEPAALPQFRMLWKPPVIDSLGIVAAGPDGRGLCISLALLELQSLSKRELTLLTRVAAHLGSGHRLRTHEGHDPLARAEAILSPSGKLLHAEASAKDHRLELDEGRKRRQEARSTRHDAERALEIWRGLVAGRWSLVDHFDTDGKRLILAMKNAPDVGREGDLTARERSVATMAAMGHRDKEIAYALGLTLSSVGSALRRTRSKMGVDSRAALAACWRKQTVLKR